MYSVLILIYQIYKTFAYNSSASNDVIINNDTYICAQMVNQAYYSLCYMSLYVVWCPDAGVGLPWSTLPDLCDSWPELFKG